MDRLRFARLKDVVVAAIDLPASQRSAYLDEACGDDGDLRARAASMLRLAGPETDLLRTGGMARILDRLGRSEGGGEALSPTSDGRATTPHLLSPGVVLAGRYRIERLLGRGGMGVVYEALDQLLSIRIALKTLRLTGPTNDEMSRAVRRLKSEVLLARTISHPHVCRMYDLGRSGDDADATWFLTMELVRGETLAERIRRQGRLRPDEALPLIEQISAALDAAHRAGIVHSDLKSGNVMLTRSGDAEHAMVMDFGLAQAVAPETDARHREPVDPDAGTTVAAVGAFGALPALAGTPAYMSPEQVLGRDASPASDVYALGIVVYEMVTGVLPFAGDTPLEIAFRRVTDSPPSPRTHVDDIDARWEATILHCLATDPAERFQRAVEVADALSRRRPVEAVPSGGPPDHHLPAEVDAFVGRSAELATLARRLEGEDRLVTLLGAAGIGKTRLALHYGWQSMQEWPGSVWFCDLSDARTADGIVSAVAKTVGVRLGGGDPVTQLGSAIARLGRSLVILDNVEQVVDEVAGVLGTWLTGAPEARFLITSRERLRLPGEITEEVETLDPTGDGIDLFAVRAAQHRSGFQIDDASRPLVRSIVETLDGLPLAIELAAARLRVLGLDALRDRLADRFALLAGGQHGRHATLRAALDWSWELLEPAERAAIAQLSVFEGGLSLGAAEAVVDLAPWPGAPTVLDVVQSLVDKSWLRARAVRGAPRFEMYAMVQEYAAERLRAWESEPGLPDTETAAAAAERRHGEHFAAMGTAEATNAVHGPGGEAIQATLALELDNLIAACRRAVRREDGATALDSLAAAAMVLSTSGPMTAMLRLAELVAGIPGLEAWRRAAAGRVLGGALHMMGRVDEARDCFTEALDLARGAGNRKLEGILLMCLANLDHERGRMEASIRRQEEALAIHRELGNRFYEAVILGNLANTYHELGRAKVAIRYHEAALAIDRENGDRQSVSIGLGNLANVEMELGRLQAARRHLEEALAIHREYGDRLGEGILLGNLGNLHREQGRPDEARRHYEEALVIHREVGNRRSEGIMLASIGCIDTAEGRADAALENYARALAIQREIEDRRFEGATLTYLGEHHESQGDPGAARRHYQEALAVFREIGAAVGEGHALGLLGGVDLLEGRLDEARQGITRGIDILGKSGETRRRAKLLCRLAECELERGDAEAARSALSAAVAIAESLDDSPGSELAQRIERVRARLAR